MKKIFIFQAIIISVTTLIVIAVFVMKPVMVPKVQVQGATGPTMVIPANPSEKPVYPLINPVVLSDLGKHYIINFRPLRDIFTKIQTEYDNTTYIYFLYLNNGAWIGLDEKELFTAASTLKVPLAISLMRAVSENKVKLSDEYDLDKLNLDSNFGDLYKVGADKRFTVEELLKIMLEKSDNTAMNAIFEIFNRIGMNDPLGDIYGVLGWEFTQEIPEMGEAIDYSKINLKTLSNMFLALYNAKYISISDSQKILSYLANTPFNDKIVAGVPKNIAVSHKIGVADPEATFSDCGIVYAPNRHYLLCIGSHGMTEKKAAQFMMEISAAAYEYVINN